MATGNLTGTEGVDAAYAAAAAGVAATERVETCYIVIPGCPINGRPVRVMKIPEGMFQGRLPYPNTRAGRRTCEAIYVEDVSMFNGLIMHPLPLDYKHRTWFPLALIVL